MKKTLLVAAMFIAIGYCGDPYIAFAVEEGRTGKDALVDCSLALEMGRPTYVEDLLKSGKPLPSVLQQAKAHQCEGYVVGFKDAMYVRQLFDEKNGLKPVICLPRNNLNNLEATKVVIKYIKGHPEVQSLPEAGVFFNAFYDAFSCTN